MIAGEESCGCKIAPNSARKELESDIVTCAIGRSGNFAVATREDNAASFLTVYDKNVNEVFKWRSSNDYIMDIALSDDGKYAAVGGSGLLLWQAVFQNVCFCLF
mgnify:CR=1 FL=1